MIDPAKASGRIAKSAMALVLLTAAVSRLHLFPIAALREAAASGAFAEENLAAIGAGAAL